MEITQYQSVEINTIVALSTKNCNLKIVNINFHKPD